MRMPDITVIIPTCNQGRYLPQALECVLGQTFPNYEVVVADDGSTDSSPAIAEYYAARHDRIKALRLTESVARGVVPIFNRAVECARGRYVAWLCAEDLWYPDTLERRFEFMEQRRDIGMMCSLYDIVDADGCVLNGRVGWDLSGDCGFRPALLLRLIRNCDIETPTVMFRRSCVETLGLFEKMTYFDWEMWMRIAARYPVGFYDDTLVMSRPRCRSAEDDAGDRLAVLQSIIKKTPVVGGWLNHPPVQAELLLHLYRLQFRLDRRVEAVESLVQALRMNPALLAVAG